MMLQHFIGGFSRSLSSRAVVGIFVVVLVPRLFFSFGGGCYPGKKKKAGNRGRGRRGDGLKLKYVADGLLPAGRE